MRKLKLLSPENLSHLKNTAVSSYLVYYNDDREIYVERFRQPWEEGDTETRFKWGVTDGQSRGRCFNRSTRKWDYSGLPSGRADSWYKTHRFDSLDEALTYADYAARIMQAERKEWLEKSEYRECPVCKRICYKIELTCERCGYSV